MEGDVLELINPVGHPRVQDQAERRILGSAAGRRVGFIWNQYPATSGFWPRLEQALEELCKPSVVERAYKNNTWSPLDETQFKRIAAAVDYLVIGVGA